MVDDMLIHFSVEVFEIAAAMAFSKSAWEGWPFKVQCLHWDLVGRCGAE